MSELPATDVAPEEEEEGLPRSCYLLEFSVLPGGARHGDVHVGTTLDALRQSMTERWMGDDIDGHLIVWYGAVLHAWVVQEGAIVAGVDLHPYLRTGDERCDRTLARVLECREERGARWGEINKVWGPYGFDSISVFPLLAQVVELQDRIAADRADTEARAALDRILEAPAKDEAAAAYDGTLADGIFLDWAAIGRALPPLREPLLTDGYAAVRWSDPGLRHPDSYLHSEGAPMSYAEVLHLGLNDLENGDDY